MTSFMTSLLSPVLCVSVLYLLSRILVQRNKAPLPPGPKPLPIIGNVHQIAIGDGWQFWRKLSKTYGDMMYVNLMGTPMLVVESHEIVVDLMEHRASLYSDRPLLPMQSLCGFDKSLVLMQNNKQFKKTRQLVQGELAPNSLAKYSGLHDREVVNFAQNLLNEPDDLITHIRHYAGAIILKLTYGYQVKGKDDPRILLPEKLISIFSTVALPGRWMVDLIPQLSYLPSWLPGMSFKRYAEGMRALQTQNSESPYLWAKQNRMSNEMVRPNFVFTHLENAESEMSEEDEDRLIWASAAIYGGGADTTVSSISTFFLAMCFYPSVQAKARAEILALTNGGTRLPNLNDRPHLPYTEAVVRETLRWHPVIPLAAHRTLKEDIYNGYRVPPSTIVVANIASMLNDPTIFPNPSTFNPDRFINNEEAVNRCARVFGFGRRSCPGKYFAEASIFTAIAVMLSLFEISDPVTLNGKPIIEKEAVWEAKVISHPLPFKCKIMPRENIQLLKEEL